MTLSIHCYHKKPGRYTHFPSEYLVFSFGILFSMFCWSIRTYAFHCRVLLFVVEGVWGVSGGGSGGGGRWGEKECGEVGGGAGRCITPQQGELRRHVNVFTEEKRQFLSLI